MSGLERQHRFSATLHFYMVKCLGYRWRGRDRASSHIHIPFAVIFLIAPGEFQQVLPAGRAGGMRGEPRINATHMETMIALGQDSDLVALQELRQADRAVGAGQLRFGGAVDRYGQRPQSLALHPGIGEPRLHILSGLEQRHPRAGATERATNDGVEPQRADEGAEQRRQNDDHVGVEAAFPHVRPARRPLGSLGFGIGIIRIEALKRGRCRRQHSRGLSPFQKLSRMIQSYHSPGAWKFL